MSRLKVSVAVAGLGVVLSASVHAAEAGDFVARARATYLDFHNGQNGMPAKVEADSRWIPEVDFSYFYTQNIAMELVLTWPQAVDIAVNGAAAGSVDALPPTLLAQYHFGKLGNAFPYVGAGVNLTLFSKRDLLGGAARTDKSSVGVAGQVGVNYELGSRWTMNLDLKYIDMHTGVHVSGSKIGTLDLNPWVASAGFGYRW